MKQGRRGRKAKGQKPAVPTYLADTSAYAGQQKVVLFLPAASAVISSSAGGQISYVAPLAFNITQDFAARFGVTFDEARLLGVEVQIRPVTASTGLSVFFFDEKDATTPDLEMAQERVGKRLLNTNANAASVTSMKWRARDLLDLEFSDVAAAPTPVYFKIYTDNANFGAPVTGPVPLWFLSIILTVEFRGISSA